MTEVENPTLLKWAEKKPGYWEAEDERGLGWATGPVSGVEGAFICRWQPASNPQELDVMKFRTLAAALRDVEVRASIF
jgi:hypothetical protein